MTESVDLEQEAIQRDRDLAWELYDFQPQHPQIAQLAQSVLARAPQFTGMIILLALHREACGDIEEARRLLQELMARRDHQFIGAAKKLRDLEYNDGDYAESLRLAELVLREDPEADWLDIMDLGNATVFVVGPEEGWRIIDDAVAMAARTDAGRFAGALGQRALRFLATGAPPERFIPAAKEAMEADPSDSIIATSLAFAYLYDYQPEKAEEILRRILREDPTDEVAQGALIVARGFLDPIERGAATIEVLRAAGMGEVAWRIMRDQLFGTGLEEALAALDAVMPGELAGSLRPPLDAEAARESGGDAKLLSWHDGQAPGSGSLWAEGWTFRLMSNDEITAMDDAIEDDPQSWPQWNDPDEYYTQVFTDDAGGYVIEGTGGRLYSRRPGVPDEEIAPSLADWVWDRVVAFGGRDPRPGRA